MMQILDFYATAAPATSSSQKVTACTLTGHACASDHVHLCSRLIRRECAPKRVRLHRAWRILFAPAPAPWCAFGAPDRALECLPQRWGHGARVLWRWQQWPILPCRCVILLRSLGVHKSGHIHLVAGSFDMTAVVCHVHTGRHKMFWCSADLDEWCHA